MKEDRPWGKRGHGIYPDNPRIPHGQFWGTGRGEIPNPGKQKSQIPGLHPLKNETVTHSSEVLLIGGQETSDVFLSSYP